MKTTLKRLTDFWLQASWITKLFICLMALMITFRLVTSCIKISLIGLEMGCDEPAMYQEKQ